MKATLHLKLTAEDTEIRELVKNVAAKALVSGIDKSLQKIVQADGGGASFLQSVLSTLGKVGVSFTSGAPGDPHAATATGTKRADGQPVALCFVLIAESGLTGSLAAQLTPAWLTRAAGALNIQLQRDVAGYWPLAMRAFVRVASSPTDIGPGEIAFAILPSLPNAPGAVAYHDVNGNAVPTAFLGLDTCSTLDDVSIAISHEIVETIGDAACDLWVDDGQGSEWAAELCDAVESNSYGINLGDGQPPIRVSDFLAPGFFAPNSAGPYNFLTVATTVGTGVISPNVSGSPSAPFVTASGGYQIKRTSGGGETQVTGKIPLAKANRKMHWSSRTARRGVNSSQVRAAL